MKKKNSRKAKPKDTLKKLKVKDRKAINKYASKTGRHPANIKVDLERMAKVPGRRESRWGNIYYEYRKNRSDKNPKTGL